MYIDGLITVGYSLNVRQSFRFGHFARSKTAKSKSEEERIGRETIQIRREVRMAGPKVTDESNNVGIRLRQFQNPSIVLDPIARLYHQGTNHIIRR